MIQIWKWDKAPKEYKKLFSRTELQFRHPETNEKWYGRPTELYYIPKNMIATRIGQYMANHRKYGAVSGHPIYVMKELSNGDRVYVMH